MSAGTLTLANNSDAVTGNGTTFTTELGAGDFIVVTVGGVPYTLPVKSVTSNTSLTLVSNFTGPAQSGAAWSAVPRTALNMVTAALVVQSAEALRGLNYDKQNWQAVFSGSENITVMLPDGSKYPGPSWKYLADNMVTKTGGAVPVAEGGTGSTTAAGARKNLELDNVATTTNGAVPISQGGTGSTTAAGARKNLELDNVATTTDGAVPISQGGTGATTVAAARTKLGLDNVAMKTAANNTAVAINDGGTGGTTKLSAAISIGSFVNNNGSIQTTGDMNNLLGDLGSAGQSYSVAATSTHTVANWPTVAWGTGKAYGWGGAFTVRCSQSGDTSIQFYSEDTGQSNIYVRHKFGSGTPRPWAAIISDKNTTVDSNGFVKKASPIVKLFGSGAYETNDESEGATVTRNGVGVYQIDGVLGMNSDRAWGGNGGGIELPKDVNGQPRVWVDYAVDADGSIVIRTYHRTHPDAPAFARNLIGTKDDAGVFTETVQNGEPIDIPEDVFISVRVEMPADSAYNLSLLESRAEQQSSSELDDEPVV